jgi:hypothetical protein
MQLLERRDIRWVTLLALVAVAGCAPVEVGSFADHAVDFTHYRSYNWAAANPKSTLSPLEQNADFRDRLHGEIERQLSAKGLEGPTSRRPDLIIRYRTTVTPRIDENRNTSDYGSCSHDCPQRTIEYDAATLVVDIVDRRTNRVIWRGWARDRLDDALNNPDRMRQKVHDAVTQMMAAYPPKA